MDLKLVAREASQSAEKLQIRILQPTMNFFPSLIGDERSKSRDSRLHRITYGKLGEGCIYGPLGKGLRQGIEITRMKKKDIEPVILQDALRGQAIGFSVRIGMYEEWNNVEAYLSLERPIIGTR
ncbi:hypothetical protein J1N35_040697 [Gossypium stocksii]|uniref:Uncharacterized protein n=1 Tax=Gossypium stocksii TaxID=47602 RepID=A0A9D3ZJ14_9ROSI|nr:hypothetical protein J1N35_040697 [Gossypium stocksii]